jgi:hypothetical protein
MKRLAFVTALTLVTVSAAALVSVPSAGAKFSISLTVDPARPRVKQPARVIARTGITLPKEHGLQLHVVGLGRDRYDTAVFYFRLRRIGPRAFGATVRFPRGGRWRLIVPNWNAQGSTYPPPVERRVKVRAAP